MVESSGDSERESFTANLNTSDAVKTRRKTESLTGVTKAIDCQCDVTELYNNRIPPATVIVLELTVCTVF